MLIDTHTHFDIILEDANISETDLLDNMEKMHVSKAVQVSIDVKGLKWSRNFAQKYKERGILFTAGIHPSSFADLNNLHQLESFIKDVLESSDKELLYGIGECGLDFYRMRQRKEMQIESFEYQITLAKKYNLPVIIHSRDAMRDTIETIKKYIPLKGIMHCFPGDRKDAKEILDLGLHISYAGNVTYKNAFNLHESALYVPLDRIFLETDSPFLTPVPLRGKKNRSEFISHTYAFIADLKKIQREKLETAINENFLSLYNS